MKLSGSWYQSALIALAVVGTVLLGAFFLRELFPEYKIYQNAYVKLEEIRAKRTGRPIPFFKEGIKQIVIPSTDNGPETIDRCISCHVALKLEHFSPTTLAKDVNGNIVYDRNGYPVQEPNSQYIWDLLPPEQDAMKTVHVDGHVYDMTKVLAMHPLLGKETRPFEFHPIEEYGCVSCHNGNGRGLVTDRAHGPVFDGQYEADELPGEPQFLESDPLNDPQFARVFNNKPGHRLLFQTTPLFVGDLIQAKCVQCHRPTPSRIEEAVGDIGRITAKKKSDINALKASLLNEGSAAVTLISLENRIEEKGAEGAQQELRGERDDPLASTENIASQMEYLDKNFGEDREVLRQIRQDLLEILGSEENLRKFRSGVAASQNLEREIEKFVKESQDKKDSLGTLFLKAQAVSEKERAYQKMRAAGTPLEDAAEQDRLLKILSTDVDRYLGSYQKGGELFISQACYACHKIAGLSRGGVGPELTEEGNSYPWFIKESIVWPQADLPTSVMPNMHLDHAEVEDLMTFLLAQKTENDKNSAMERRVQIREWEAGKKQPLERAVVPTRIYDLEAGMKVFALEGCAACHRLKGYESDTGYAIEKGNPSFDARYQEGEWFRSLFPEGVLGSKIVRNLERHAKEIDLRIVPGVRNGALLDKIEQERPGALGSFYSNFAYAFRSKNYELRTLAEQERDPEEKKKIVAELEAWKGRVHRILMMYIQEYGLGRQIGPKLNWSGVSRSNQWLMEHFWNPQGHIPRSIMPAFPFDHTKFLSLVHMLNVLGKKNRDELRQIWEVRKFNPSEAYQLLCAQCHGENLQGDGPVAEWIYPIPKNLRDPQFLRNLTQANVQEALAHGVKGTPMPPWGEVGADKKADGVEPVLNRQEITELARWLFETLPFQYIYEEKENPKWEYSPKDVIKELQQQNRGQLPSSLEQDVSQALSLKKFDQYYASLRPMVSIDGEKIDENQLFDCLKKGNPENKASGCYIKKKFYTPENLAEGERLFVLNCAICHGRQGDGAGLRAGTMREAKPRMLTNFHWLRTRDDLRLLRSIKYGVQGTSMQAFGDVTSILQRLQLVMYIHSLSEEQILAQRLSDTVYKAFDQTIALVKRAGVDVYAPIGQLKQELDNTRDEKRQSIVHLQEGKVDAAKVEELYARELELLAKIDRLESGYRYYEQLLSLLRQRKELFQQMGNSILAASAERADSIFPLWLELIGVSGNDFALRDGRLGYREPQTEKIGELLTDMKNALEKNMRQLERNISLLKGKILSQNISEQIDSGEQRLQGLHRIYRGVMQTMEEATDLRSREKEIFMEHIQPKKGQGTNDANSV